MIDQSKEENWSNLCQHQEMVLYTKQLLYHMGEEEIAFQELECSYLVYGRETGKDGTPHL